MLQEQQRARASRSELLNAQAAHLTQIGDQWPAFQQLQVGLFFRVYLGVRRGGRSSTVHPALAAKSWLCPVRRYTLMLFKYHGHTVLLPLPLPPNLWAFFVPLDFRVSLESHASSFFFYAFSRLFLAFLFFVFTHDEQTNRPRWSRSKTGCF